MHRGNPQGGRSSSRLGQGQGQGRGRGCLLVGRRGVVDWSDGKGVCAARQAGTHGQAHRHPSEPAAPGWSPALCGPTAPDCRLELAPQSAATAGRWTGGACRADGVPAAFTRCVHTSIHGSRYTYASQHVLCICGVPTIMLHTPRVRTPLSAISNQHPYPPSLRPPRLARVAVIPPRPSSHARPVSSLRARRPRRSSRRPAVAAPGQVTVIVERGALLGTFRRLLFRPPYRRLPTFTAAFPQKPARRVVSSPQSRPPPARHPGPKQFAGNKGWPPRRRVPTRETSRCRRAGCPPESLARASLVPFPRAALGVFTSGRRMGVPGSSGQLGCRHSNLLRVLTARRSGGTPR